MGTKKSTRGGARPGAGRPPILEDAVRVVIYLDGPVADGLMEYADEEELGLSQYARKVLTRHLHSRQRRDS